MSDVLAQVRQHLLDGRAECRAQMVNLDVLLMQFERLIETLDELTGGSIELPEAPSDTATYSFPIGGDLVVTSGSSVVTSVPAPAWGDGVTVAAVSGYQCPECPKAFDKEHGLRVHRIRAHGERAKHGAAADPARVAKIEARAKAAAKLAAAQANTVVARPRGLRCLQCPKLFGTEVGLDIHINTVHPATTTPAAEPVVTPPAAPVPVDGDQVVGCSDCSFVTFAATGELMMEHVAKVHKRTRLLAEKRPFTLGGGDDGGRAA